MVHEGIMIHGQKDFATPLIAVQFDVFPGGLWQLGELLARIIAVKADDEAPNLGVLADQFAGKDSDSVDRAFIEIGFDQEHDGRGEGGWAYGSLS
jgi:hypothetical protein